MIDMKVGQVGKLSSGPQARPAREILHPNVTIGSSPANARRAAGRSFGHDFASIRVTPARLPTAVLGRTLDADHVEITDSRATSGGLLVHELAHVAQHRNFGPEATHGALEAEASEAADKALRGESVTVRGVAGPASRLHSTLSDELKRLWTTSHDKAQIFDELRKGQALGDADARRCLRGIFAAGSDDLWLGEAILDNGPETLWGPTLVGERAKRAAGGKWAPEAGDIQADLADPYGESGAPVVHAHFFPGRSERRALVIAGVHGTEPGGTEVVELLRTKLRAESAAGRPPFFTTILVPVLIKRTAGTRSKLGSRWVGGGKGLTKSGVLETSRDIEPNRNFPLPGEDLAAAKARGAAKPDDPELQMLDAGAVRTPHDKGTKSSDKGSSIRMLAENRILISLIERFQPERLASVHSHSLKSAVGDAPGMFVDPRGLDPKTGKVIDQAAVDEDDRLATAMLAEGKAAWDKAGTKVARTKEGVLESVSDERKKFAAASDPFAGNRIGKGNASVHYAPPANTPEGNSLGTWAPVATKKSDRAKTVDRAAIATVTVEVPNWHPKENAAALDKIEDIESSVLLTVFLGDPSTQTPATGPTKPPTK